MLPFRCWLDICSARIRYSAVFFFTASRLVGLGSPEIVVADPYIFFTKQFFLYCTVKNFYNSILFAKYHVVVVATWITAATTTKNYNKMSFRFSSSTLQSKVKGLFWWSLWLAHGQLSRVDTVLIKHSHSSKFLTTLTLHSLQQQVHTPAIVGKSFLVVLLFFLLHSQTDKLTGFVQVIRLYVLWVATTGFLQTAGEDWCSAWPGDLWVRGWRGRDWDRRWGAAFMKRRQVRATATTNVGGSPQWLVWGGAAWGHAITQLC